MRLSEVGLVEKLCLLVGLLCLVLEQHSCQDVIGCGGFVRSNKNIDTSRIQVSLLNNKNGNLRKIGSTDCAPLNGYYFIPVYENGDYVLKASGPRGWKIEPAEISVKVDGANDDCSKNVDINFEFIGFGITGSVLSQGSTTGPSGISIELMTPDSMSILQTVTTNDEGHFDFFGVSPGSYFVRVSKIHTNSYAFDSEQRTVIVGEDVGICQPFRIEGYELKGDVRLSNDKPLANIPIIIIPQQGADLSPINLKTDGEGSFRRRLSNGKYVIKAGTGSTNMKFNKPEVEVTIEHQNVFIDTFRVESFEVTGMVTTAEVGGKKVADAKVEVAFDGKVMNLITAKDGSFTVKDVRQGKVSAKVSVDGYQYGEVALEIIEPGAQFPPIFPVSYRVAGKVDVESIPTGTELKLKYASSDKSKSHSGYVLTSPQGIYSTFLPAGRYLISVELGGGSSNIGFAPFNHEITIKDSPVTGINFVPIKANLEGKVVLLGAKHSTVEVYLTSSNNQVQTVTTDAKGNYRFSGILPGIYTVSVTKNDFRCWDKSSQQVTVSENVKDVVFNQVGYKVQAHSVRSATLVVNNGVQEVENPIVRGDNSICIDSQKPITLSTKGCVEYDVEPDRIDDPSTLDSSFRIILKPIKYTVSGFISSKEVIPDLKLVASSDTRKVEVETAKTPSGYSFSFMAFPGEDLGFNPSSEEFLFEPESLHVLVDNDCHLDSVQFEGRPGFFLRGKVMPEVEDVKVDVLDSATGNVVVSVITDKQGTYKVGPLPPDPIYKVVAEKEGYILEEVAGQQGIFNTKKLASILVKVTDEADGTDLSGVVVSLSGGNDYRSNTVTKSQGEAVFLSLAPGKYFAKPQIKEYEFDPKSMIVELNDGESSNLSFKGKRVAFSIFGKITSLNGEPEPFVTLKAKAVSPQTCVGHSEEATSEEKGDFRFRGLQPHCEYLIGLGSEVSDIESLIPAEVKVLVGLNDAELLTPIMAMRPFALMDTIIIVSDDQPSATPVSVKVGVTSESGFSFSSFGLVGQLIAMPRVPTDNQTYSLTVDSPTNGRATPHKRAFARFKADQYSKIVEVTLARTSPTQNKTVRKISGFVFLFPVIIAILTVWLLFDKMPLPVQNLIERLAGSLNGNAVQKATAYNTGEWDDPKRRAKKRASN